MTKRMDEWTKEDWKEYDKVKWEKDKSTSKRALTAAEKIAFAPPKPDKSTPPLDPVILIAAIRMGIVNIDQQPLPPVPNFGTRRKARDIG